MAGRDRRTHPRCAIPTGPRNELAQPVPDGRRASAPRRGSTPRCRRPRTGCVQGTWTSRESNTRALQAWRAPVSPDYFWRAPGLFLFAEPRKPAQPAHVAGRAHRGALGRARLTTTAGSGLGCGPMLLAGPTHVLAQWEMSPGRAVHKSARTTSGAKFGAFPAPPPRD